MKEIVWKLFKLTGDIKYYIMFTKLEGDVIDQKDRGNSN